MLRDTSALSEEEPGIELATFRLAVNPLRTTATQEERVKGVLRQNRWEHTGGKTV